MKKIITTTLINGKKKYENWEEGKNATKTHKFCKNFMNEIIQAAGRRCLCTNKEATHANRLARKSCFCWRLIYYIDCWMTPIHARLFHLLLLFIFFLLSNVYLMEWDGVWTGWWWVGSAFSSWGQFGAVRDTSCSCRVTGSRWEGYQGSTPPPFWEFFAIC